jgi:class 3 adenylate cyclase/tetratricopeptide (TPR) repeat protein
VAETRKTVTIVFADVTGSTALGEQTDPETMRRIMEHYFEEMRAVLEHHGGTVEKFIGDAVMAVFGIPTVREDDALRAVRAAAEMRTRLAALNEEFERDRGITIAVRTGVNTGEVIAGDPVAGQAFATGDAVNVAARLEQAAAPGEILVGELTHRLVREAVRAEPVEPLELKGKSETVEARRLVEVLPDVPAFTRRLDAPFVGRTQELATLREAFELARERGGAELVTVVAPAGMGKSRLARELVAGVHADARVVVGRCLPYGDGITYWPLAEIIRQVAGGDADDGLRALLTDEEDGQVVARHLSVVLGRSDAPSRNEEIGWATRRLFEALARDRPLVAVVDDIHWAEATLLDLVEYIVGFAAAPLLVLCLARPDLFDSRPSWALPRAHATTVLLDPLGDEAAKTLVHGLLSDAELNERVRSEIIDRAEGNPLFVEQMLAHARASGNGEITVPPTIQALLTARIDSLDQGELAIVERGAIEGRLFHRGAVVSSLSAEQPDITGDLMTLVRKELIRPDEAEFPGEDAFRFVHILIRDAVYASVPKERRADLHGRFADWLEEHASARLAEFAEIIGYHLEQSHYYRMELGFADDRTIDLGRRAGDRLAAAGKRALDRGDVSAAINLLRRASQLFPQDDVGGLELAPSLAAGLFESGRAADAARTLDEAAFRAHKLGANRVETLISLHRSHLEIQLDPHVDVDQIFESARGAIERFEQADDDHVLAMAWYRIHEIEWFRGHLTAARAAGERALTYAERAGDIRLQAELRTYIAAVGFFTAEPLEVCLANAEENLEWAQAQGALAHEAMVLHALGNLALEERRPEEGRELRERGWTMLDELGMRIAKAGIQGAGSFFLGESALDPEAVITRLRSSYEVLAAAEETGVLSTVASNLASALYDVGEYDEAERLSRESEQLGSTEDVTTQVGWRAVRAMVLARRGHLENGEELAREALERALVTEYLELVSGAYLSLGEVLRLGGRFEEAREAIEQALALYERKGLALSADAVRAKLAGLQSVGSPSQ